ncbi:hypothetical protein VP01_1033g1 [Puccinia sorghi]|uniref:Uncharacterized protein n=1 Tax=Puccinia sorghi TaxID=27349 RepID=A0A0L6VVY2_9BASI|nr:hypothetical protein VP01_1033g1 [Puccinia sorghi]
MSAGDFSQWKKWKGELQQRRVSYLLVKWLLYGLQGVKRCFRRDSASRNEYCWFPFWLITGWTAYKLILWNFLNFKFVRVYFFGLVSLAWLCCVVSARLGQAKPLSSWLRLIGLLTCLLALLWLKLIFLVTCFQLCGLSIRSQLVVMMLDWPFWASRRLTLASTGITTVATCHLLLITRILLANEVQNIYMYIFLYMSLMCFFFSDKNMMLIYLSLLFANLLTVTRNSLAVSRFALCSAHATVRVAGIMFFDQLCLSSGDESGKAEMRGVCQNSDHPKKVFLLSFRFHCTLGLQLRPPFTLYFFMFLSEIQASLISMPIVPSVLLIFKIILSLLPDLRPHFLQSEGCLKWRWSMAGSRICLDRGRDMRSEVVNPCGCPCGVCNPWVRFQSSEVPDKLGMITQCPGILSHRGCSESESRKICGLLDLCLIIGYCRCKELEAQWPKCTHQKEDSQTSCAPAGRSCTRPHPTRLDFSRVVRSLFFLMKASQSRITAGSKHAGPEEPHSCLDMHQLYGHARLSHSRIMRGVDDILPRDTFSGSRPWITAEYGSLSGDLGTSQIAPLQLKPKGKNKDKIRPYSQIKAKAMFVLDLFTSMMPLLFTICAFWNPISLGDFYSTYFPDDFPLGILRRGLETRPHLGITVCNSIEERDRHGNRPRMTEYLCEVWLDWLSLQLCTLTRTRRQSKKTCGDAPHIQEDMQQPDLLMMELQQQLTGPPHKVYTPDYSPLCPSSSLQCLILDHQVVSHPFIFLYRLRPVSPSNARPPELEPAYLFYLKLPLPQSRPSRLRYFSQ